MTIPFDEADPISIPMTKTISPLPPESVPQILTLLKLPHPVFFYIPAFAN
jgi:hypothetical protein